MSLDINLTGVEKTSNKKTNLTDNSDTFYPTQKAVKTAVDAKFNTPTGTTAQYLRGDGSLETFPTIPDVSDLQSKAVVVSTNQTAVNDAWYINVANATYTDPSPIEGKGYRVFVRNGTATINSVAYTEGTTILRLFHSGSWVSYVSLPDSNFVPTSRTINGLDLSANRTLTIENLGFFHLDFAPSGVVTGTTSETQVGVIEIPANSIKSIDQLKIYTPLIKSGGAAAVTITYKLSTSSTMPSGTTGRIANFSAASNNTWIPMQRNPMYNGGNLTLLLQSVSSVNDLAVGLNAPSVIAYDRTQTLYLYVSVTLANGADSIYLAGGHITNM
jgi:hypothetical protein